jgi:hypothetical protein
MPRKQQSKGKCAYCEVELAKSAMTKHLPACPQRLEIIARAEQQKSKAETLYHLRVQAEYLNQFWLDLEMRGAATLEDLDQYLRAIWLECCGHMSQFSVGGWGGRELSKKQTVSKVFKPDLELTHIYDFGTESVTLIKTVGVREGKPTTSHPIALLARNVTPEAPCIECGQQASWLCMECMIEEEKWGVLCNKHAEDHPHSEYGEPVHLVNSPRMGLCGYEGPAEPPY